MHLFAQITEMNDEEKLFRAIDINDVVTISSLIASGIVKNQLCSRSPLVHAALRGRANVVRMLLDDDRKHHLKACHAAIYHRYPSVLNELLVEREAFVNDRSLLVVVSRSFQSGDQMAVALLDAGASPDDLTNDELISLCSVASVENEGDVSLPVLRRLLARGVNVSALRSSDGSTLCHIAVTDALDDVDVDELLRTLVTVAGVDVNAVDDNGSTALHRAALVRNFKAIRLLVAELGADVDRQRFDDSCTALHMLSDSSRDWNDVGPCVELLLALGANVCLVNSESGDSPCHAATRARAFAALCAFLAAGGDLDQPNNNDETPRTIASREKVSLPTADAIDAARRRIASIQLGLVRHRAAEICIGLYSLNLDALQMCEIMVQACAAFGSLMLFHQWWTIATKVKHFQSKILL